MPDTFEEVRAAILKGRVVVSRHALHELGDDRLELDQALEVTVSGEVVEDYPRDPRGPSCLVCSTLDLGLWVHTVWGWDAGTETAVLITAYRPHPEKWDEEFKKRKR
ncbi:MAG TPA: DUF4258 domain-containing protein [Thermoanaerobaculia bacterium]|jgi:hypothetical protein|nr:DUF4258 domain-containing protein [Thermoanaerobaculia bacterium]